MNKNRSEIKRAQIKQSLLHFGTLYRVHNIYLQIGVTIITGLILGFFQYLTVEITGLYELGIAAVCQSIARLSFYFLENNLVYNLLFWLLNVLANIPLFILGFRKIGKKFTMNTFITMAIIALVGLMCSQFITNTDKMYLFGKLNFIPYKDFELNILTWSNLSGTNISIFIYGLIWGAFQAIFTTLLLIIEGCTGGFDFLGVYESKKRFKDVGGILGLLHFISLVIANFFGTYLPYALATRDFSIQHYFSPTFIGGLVMVLFNLFLLNILFPKFKMVKVEIMTNEPYKIIDQLNSLKDYRFSTSVLNVKGGYSKMDQSIVLTVCLYMDAAKLLEVVNELDPKAFIYITELKKANGYIYVVNQYKDEIFDRFKRNKNR